MSSEPTVSPPSPEPCASCGAPLAPDQRYCLECGARRAYLSSTLAGAVRGAPVLRAVPEDAAAQPPAPRASATPAVIAGVGVLLLAMGVGVLIGRSSASSGRETAGATPIISLTTPTSGATGAAASTATFTDDWPSGSNGYTVQLQTLPEAGTAVSAVQAAKAAAVAKGATAVGALKSDDHASLPTGSYVLYSGVYTKKAQAQSALAGLKRSFPGAKVIQVSSTAAGASTSTGSSHSSGSGSGVGESPSKPAPPTVLKSLRSKGGGSYEQKSKNLPNVVSTG